MEILKDEYMINEKTVAFTGEYDRFGHSCTRVIDGEDTFLVNQKPVELIEKALLCLGSDFKGARKSSKVLLGNMHMYPIKVNCNLGIWLFPTKSYRNDNCIWFSLAHVKKTKTCGIRKTRVYLSYNHEFVISMKESSFNNKKQKAEQLRESMTKLSQSPLTFYLEPKQGLRLTEERGINPYKLK